MLMPDLFRSIHRHAEEIAGELVADLQQNPRTPYLHGLSDDEFHRRAFELYSNLARWIASPREQEIARVYGELGRHRSSEGIPASQLIEALVLAKSHLCDFVRRNDATESTIEMYQQGELHEMINEFFDLAIIHALRGYEAESSEARETLREPRREWSSLYYGPSGPA